MKKLLICFIISILSISINAQTLTIAQQDSAFVRDNYVKSQVMIEMRDGVKLFTNIYAPKDASPTNQYPIVMQRTCYDVSPYGKNEYPQKLYSRYMMREKFIFVEHMSVGVGCRKGFGQI